MFLLQQEPKLKIYTVLLDSGTEHKFIQQTYPTEKDFDIGDKFPYMVIEKQISWPMPPDGDTPMHFGKVISIVTKKIPQA
jgi:hypothetical protein